MTVTSSLNETFTDQLGNNVVGRGGVEGVTPPNPHAPPPLFTGGFWTPI